MTAPNTSNRPAPESVRWTNPQDRYTIIRDSSVDAPEGSRFVLVGTPVTTNGGGVVTPGSVDVGKYLDMGTGELVVRATVDEWLADWNAIQTVHPDWTPKQIQDEIANGSASSSEPAPSAASAQSIHLDPSSPATDLHNTPIPGLGTLPTPSTDPNDTPIGGNSAPIQVAVGDATADPRDHVDLAGSVQIGDYASALNAEGNVVHAVILPHAQVSRMAALIGEIRNHVPASVAHFVTELEHLASEIRAHL